jgi:hypothetical protein
MWHDALEALKSDLDQAQKKVSKYKTAVSLGPVSSAYFSLCAAPGKIKTHSCLQAAASQRVPGIIIMWRSSR